MAGKNGAIKLVAGNSNPALAQAIADYLKTPLTKAVVRRFADMEIFVEIQENVRGADVFVIQSTSYPGQRPPDGIADHHRRAAPLVGAPHHRGDPLFRLCPAGPQTGAAHADLGQAGRQPDHPRRRRPGDDARPACRADPGLLRHPDRQSLRLAGDGARHQASASSSTTSWWCRPTSAAWCARAGWPSASTRRSPSSTSGASAPANPK